MTSKTQNGKQYSDADLHLPPHNLDAEVSLVGSMLLHPLDVIGNVDCNPQYFYDDRNVAVSSCIITMHCSGAAIDPVTVGETLQRTGQFERAGGAVYLDALAEAATRPEHALCHSDIVKRLWKRRTLIRDCDLLKSEAYYPDSDVDGLIERAVDRLSSAKSDVKTPVSFAGADASELADYAEQTPDWLVDGVFTVDESLLVGARSKCCKTLQLTDLAVALASGLPWMNAFDIPKRRKVLFISGETNFRRISQHIKKACQARGLRFSDLSGWLRVEAARFPCLPDINDQFAIHEDIQKHGFELVICDPLYRGLTGVDSSRLNEIGPALKSFQSACQPACMALSHHVIKSAAREYGSPPALEDMTGAGLAESCGQWWLVGRNEKYAWDWKHDLCVQFGGREGQGGGRRILFNEYNWTFQVEPWSEFVEQKNSEEQQQRDDARCEALERKRASARALILKAVKNVKTPQSKTAIEGAAGAVQTAFRYVFGEMVREQTLVQRPYRDNQNRVQPVGYLLAEYAAEYDKSQMLVDAS